MSNIYIGTQYDKFSTAVVQTDEEGNEFTLKDLRPDSHGFTKVEDYAKMWKQSQMDIVNPPLIEEF